MRLTYWVTPVSFAVGIGFATCATAQTGPATQLEEIIVTAQKRAESIQDVPIAISAFTVESLANLRIQSTDDLERFTPNLTWKPAGGVGGSIGLRGVVDTVFTTNQVGSVAIVVDDVGLNSPVINTFALLDVERVEVLRGPQVTLYGRSTTGGAVNLVTRHPRVEDGGNGYVQATVGAFSQFDVEAAGGMALGDRWAVRGAVLSQNRDGIIENQLTGADDSNRQRHAERLSIAGQIGDSTTMFVSVHNARNRGENYRYKDVGMLDPVTGGPCTTIRNANPGNGCVDGAGFADDSDFSHSWSNLPRPQDDIDAYGGNVNLAWQLGGFALTSITAYEHSKIRRAEDSDGGALSLSDVYYSADTDQWSQELRLASTGPKDQLAWVAGVYYLREDQEGLTAAMLSQGTDVGPPPQFRSQAFDQRDTVASAYGQLDLPFAERWTLTAGVRYSSETKQGLSETLRAPGFIAVPASPPYGTFLDEAFARSISVAVDAPPPDFEPVPAPFLAPYDKTWNNWGGKLGVSFRPNDRTLLYGSISEGFKGGTFNFAAAVRLSSEPQRINFQQGVNPEKLTTYEIGGKFELLERTLRLNVAVFRNDYKDQQTFTFKDGGPVLVNAAKSTIDGAEVELEWLPAPGWTVSSGLGLLNARYDEFIDTDGTVYSGNDMIQAPDMNWSGTIRRSWDTSVGAFSAQVGFQHVSDQYFGVDNAPVTLVEAYTLYDAQLRLAFGDGARYDVTAWGRNLGDERFCLYTGTLPFGNAQCIINEPRTYGVTFRAKF